MENNKKIILITGGAGYLGTHIVKKLLGRGYRVRIYDSLMHGQESITEFVNNPNFELIKGDLRDFMNIQKAIRGCYAVIHLAAIVGDPASKIDPDTTIAINYLATTSIVQCCKLYGIRRFIFASTCSVYGMSDNILTEESKLNPISLYAVTKIKSEEAILQLADKNFSPTIFRKGTIYGLSSRMRFDLVVNLLSARAIFDKIITIYGGNQWRPFLHVADAADAYLIALESPIEKIHAKIFNVGDDQQNYQLNEIGNIIKKIVPAAELKILDDNIDLRNYRVSFKKINKELGFKSKLTVVDGVQEIIKAINNKLITNYKDRKYHNYLSGEEEYYKSIIKYDSIDKF